MLVSMGSRQDGQTQNFDIFSVKFGQFLKTFTSDTVFSIEFRNFRHF